MMVSQVSRTKVAQLPMSRATWTFCLGLPISTARCQRPFAAQVATPTVNEKGSIIRRKDEGVVGLALGEAVRRGRVLGEREGEETGVVGGHGGDEGGGNSAEAPGGEGQHDRGSRGAGTVCGVTSVMRRQMTAPRIKERNGCRTPLKMSREGLNSAVLSYLRRHPSTGLAPLRPLPTGHRVIFSHPCSRYGSWLLH